MIESISDFLIGVLKIFSLLAFWEFWHWGYNKYFNKEQTIAFARIAVTKNRLEIGKALLIIVGIIFIVIICLGILDITLKGGS